MSVQIAHNSLFFRSSIVLLDSQDSTNVHQEKHCKEIRNILGHMSGGDEKSYEDMPVIKFKGDDDNVHYLLLWSNHQH